MGMKIRLNDMKKLFGLSVNGVKLYESQGIISPARKQENGYRLFGVNEMQVMGYAAQLRRFGFSMQETSSMLHEPGGSSRLSEAMEERERRIEGEIDALLLMRRTLRDWLHLQQETRRLQDTCEAGQSPAMHFLGMRRGESWLSRDSIEQSREWIRAYSPHSFSAILLDGPYFQREEERRQGTDPLPPPQSGMAVPARAALTLVMRLSSCVTYILPKPCLCTAFRIQYDAPDFSGIICRVRSYADQHNLRLQGGGFALITECTREDNRVLCLGMLWVPLLEEENQYGILR